MAEKNEGPMQCPFCGRRSNSVIDSRAGARHEFIRRRRICSDDKGRCGRRFTTYEYVEDVIPRIKKRDGRIEPFQRRKLEYALRRVASKRSPTAQIIPEIIEEISGHIAEEFEVVAEELWNLCLEALQKRGDVATAVRFASGRDCPDLPALLKALKRHFPETTKPAPPAGRRTPPQPYSARRS